ncbi:ComEA family DNA-binding protein [Paradesertivirga mongoliensis]|uniref:ComEA family DNA-binding protein n=1 Tax=Paradesertivirga mongoliensis TaxID=2100740 RepID=A0ABW4ZNL4_9SPHI|nr:helix-hairpin-helix domain-containing protein [Pedobacter mongoliensis]
MNFKVLLFTGFLSVVAIKLRAQESNDHLIENIIESLSETATEDFDYSELQERLNHYQKNPFNLNKVSLEQLQELMFLTPLQIQSLIEYRNKNGPLIELLELQSISAFDDEAIKRLIPFCTLSDASTFPELNLKNLFNKGKAEWMFTYAQVLHKQKGYESGENSTGSGYAGSPQRFLSRYRYNYGESLSAAITMEKDPGEAFFSGAQTQGFDFYSANVSFKGKGRLRKLVLGDYSLQFGQGLTMWSGLSFGKGAAVAAITKNNIGLRPYSSTNEVLFLRGVSATVNFRNWDFTPFVSIRNLDGRVDEVDGAKSISSLNTTGFHRTGSEIETQKAIIQKVYGANLQFADGGWRLGLTAYQTMFGHPFDKNNSGYSIAGFASDKLTNLGAYYNYSWRNFYFFGEAAKSFGSGTAFLNGVLASISPKVSLIVFQRNYQKNYHSFFNQAVSEGTNAVNEKGFYSGLVISPGKKTEFNFYADFFKFPWLRFRVDAPSSGHEFLSQFSHSPSKRTNIILRYKYEQKEENDAGDYVMNYLVDVKKQNYRLEFNYKISKALELRNRLEMVAYEKDKNSENGFMTFQDILYRPLSSKFSGNIRFALFDTPGFNSRVYAFENDILYSYSIPAYQNSGIRFYINGRWRINRSTDLWCRYALSSYTNIESIGTGPEEIEGHNKSDVKLQLRFQF